MNILHWANTNGSAIQAASTIVLVLLTACYVALTFRLAVHSRRDLEIAQEGLEHARSVADRQSQDDSYKYLGDLWYEILQSCADRPQFLNARITREYRLRMVAEERSSYDVYCYKVWAYVEDIVAKGFHHDPQFHPIIEWAVAYHLEWLECNPMFFPLAEFWDTINSMKQLPQLTSSYLDLPSKDGDIDWDVVSEQYDELILGPFAPEMVAPDASGHRRNLLLDELLAGESGPLSALRIADFGCGPGNLLPYLAGRIDGITGVDRSPGALRFTAEVAAQYGIEFVSHQADFLNLQLNDEFDIIISVNSILPPARSDVVPILLCERNSGPTEGSWQCFRHMTLINIFGNSGLSTILPHSAALSMPRG